MLRFLTVIVCLVFALLALIIVVIPGLEEWQDRRAFIKYWEKTFPQHPIMIVTFRSSKGLGNDTSFCRYKTKKGIPLTSDWIRGPLPNAYDQIVKNVCSVFLLPKEEHPDSASRTLFYLASPNGATGHLELYDESTMIGWSLIDY